MNTITLVSELNCQPQLQPQKRQYSNIHSPKSGHTFTLSTHAYQSSGRHLCRWVKWMSCTRTEPGQTKTTSFKIGDQVRMKVTMKVATSRAAKKAHSYWKEIKSDTYHFCGLNHSLVKLMIMMILAEHLLPSSSTKVKLNVQVKNCIFQFRRERERAMEDSLPSDGLSCSVLGENLVSGEIRRR